MELICENCGNKTNKFFKVKELERFKEDSAKKRNYKIKVVKKLCKSCFKSMG